MYAIRSYYASSEGFVDLLKDRRDRKQRFFQQRPPQVIDVCQVPLGVRLN